MSSSRPLTVAIHRSLDAWQPEIEFVFRTLFTIAGYPIRLRRLESPESSIDVYYGPPSASVRPAVWIPCSGRKFTDAPSVTARALIPDAHGQPRLLLDGVAVESTGLSAGLVFEDDIVFTAYWLLTGAREPFYPRSKAGDLDMAGSPLIRDGVLDTPLVSLWGAALRAHFRASGLQPIAPPWAPEGKAAFAFTHDVDYPEVIRWLEPARLLLQKKPGLAWRTLTGRSTHWTFSEWVVFEREFGARPCFYFMARQGSLWQYARGTPDDFYDVGAPQFTRLFAELRDAGAEIGLHASFHAHRDAGTIRSEVDRIRSASRGPVHGNRHHYWHLDPDDPNTTLARHAEAGLEYDSSLGLEYYPGFRRGICHPFRPFDPRTRRMIETIQLPPAWMDDHFDRRLSKNGIADPDQAGRRLVSVAAQTGGIVVVDYHSRGMNRDAFPRYGLWLERFGRANLPSAVAFHLPHEIADMYRTYERTLAAS